MLILAGVSLNAIIGDNGIINSAQNAKKQAIIEDEKEKIKVLYAEALLEEDNVYKTFEKSIKKEFGDDTIVTDLLDDSFGIEKNSERKMKYVVNPDGSVEDDTYKLWNGTSVEPTNKTSTEIHIYTAEELKWLSNQVNSGNAFAGYTIYLENNLDLGARQKDGELIKGNKWTPIGFLDNGSAIILKGIFDGQNHTIKGVYVNCKSYSGVFGLAHIIKNLTVRNSYFRTTSVCSAGICGDIMKVGDERGLIKNCHNINCKVISGTNYAGGVTAYSPNSDIEDCSNSGIVIGSQCTAGIVGYAYDTKVIKNCVNYGFVQSRIIDTSNTSSGSSVAGIAGYSVAVVLTEDRVVENCKNFGMVCGSNKWIGGIVGINSGSLNSFFIIRDCYNDGKIYSENRSGRVAGILGNGNRRFLIYNCINNGNIDSYGDGRYAISCPCGAGGIVGTSGVAGYIFNCINYGSVKGDTYVGGIVGGHYVTESDEMGEALASYKSIDRLRYCINYGEVESVVGLAGGIFGSMEYGSDQLNKFIYQCLNYGSVRGVYAGGLIGGKAGASYSVNLGKVSGTNTDGVIWDFVDGLSFSYILSVNPGSKWVGYYMDKNDITRGMIYTICGSTNCFDLSSDTPKVRTSKCTISGHSVSISLQNTYLEDNKSMPTWNLQNFLRRM